MERAGRGRVNLVLEHAGIRGGEVEAHLDDNWFAWLSEVDPDGVYDYRVPNRQRIGRP